jgi:hypothetical protein
MPAFNDFRQQSCHELIGARSVVQFDLHVTVHLDKFLIIRPTRYTNLSNLLWNETLHVSDSSSVHRQEFFTLRTAMVYVKQVC